MEQKDLGDQVDQEAQEVQEDQEMEMKTRIMRTGTEGHRWQRYPYPT